MLLKKQIFILNMLNEIFPYDERFDALKLYNRLRADEFKFSEVADICLSLQKEGYLEKVNVSEEKIIDNLALTYKGRNYKKYQNLEIHERWKERIFGVISGAVLASVPWLLALIRTTK